MSNYINAQDNMLSKKQEKIITVAAFAATGELDRLKPELVAGLEAGLTVNEIKEVLVHLYAYCGFPRSLRGLQTFMSVLDERKAAGISDSRGREATPVTDTRNKYERGKEILAKLSGVTPPEGRSTAGYAGFSPEIETFLKEHFFADIFERDVLTYAQREMVTVAVLMSVGGVEPMLSSHINLALNTGVTPVQLQQMTDIIKVNLGSKQGDTAQAVLNELLKQKGLPAGNNVTELENGVTMQKIIFHNRISINLAGNLYLPADCDKNKKYPAIVVGHTSPALKNKPPVCTRKNSPNWVI
jgi:alkylhydroperoxidase/carboxymuconolactone decarboxylase family protein YurZ